MISQVVNESHASVGGEQERPSRVLRFDETERQHAVWFTILCGASTRARDYSQVVEVGLELGCGDLAK